MAKIEPKTTKEHIVNIYNKIEQLETNHIYHLQKEVKRLNYVLWTVGFMVATQFIANLLKVFQ
jgi:hypothetical protein|tara:strand:- start:316 stop:504 length:189 start_codon:yes stop_codon:yes gene_type:complete